MALIPALLATLAAGLFTGGAVYITFAEHPARVSCGSVLAVTEFGPSYKRATVMQASLALIGASAGITRWATGGGLGWLVGGVVLGAVVPFTPVVILPTNHRLLTPLRTTTHHGQTTGGTCHANECPRGSLHLKRSPAEDWRQHPAGRAGAPHRAAQPALSER